LSSNYEDIDCIVASIKAYVELAVPYSTNDYDIEEEIEEEEPEERRIRFWIWGLICVLLAGTGTGSAFAWRAFGGTPYPPSPFSPAKPVAAVKPAEQRDLEALREQIASTTQSTEKLLTAQQAQIKQLADQVTVLTNKLDLLQQPIAGAQAAVPARPVDQPKRPAATKPVAAKPTQAQPPNQPGSTISTGGAPLPRDR
jgi:hypothetical protein